VNIVHRKESASHPRNALAFAHELLALPAHRAFPLFVHRRNTHRTERLFVSTLITIQTLAQRCGIKPFVLHPFATLIPILGLHPVVLDAEYIEPAVQVKPDRTCLITGHHVTGELLHGLWSRRVDLTAYPAILGVGVNAEFDRFVGGG
jgi:hypothetical protein